METKQQNSFATPAWWSLLVIHRWQGMVFLLVLATRHTLAFSPCIPRMTEMTRSSSPTTTTTTTTTAIHSNPPRTPRRMLKKRRRNPKTGGSATTTSGTSTTRNNDFPWDTAESRPLVKSVSREAGEDYWMDETELAAFEAQQEQQRLARRNYRALVLQRGQVSTEKLWTEVKAPYKQNWIGYFSVGIAILTTIIIQFPELLDQPTIPIPDL